ncbi:hypothetical protein [Aquabacterium sp.]|uniref:hypothetical protein n=1 Tax=Aquabacterium sp. TaxID=1872578 RepID=UPI003D6D80B5
MTLNHITRALAGLGCAVSIVLLTGCAHPITLVPDLATVPAASAKINKTAGYVVSAEDMAKEVETPGGGGDKVKYAPYKDLDVGLYKSFSQVFTNVVKLKSVNDVEGIASQGVSLVISPSIATDSSSSSAFTWPPTKFTITLTCTVVDAKGAPVTVITSKGEGAAEFSEFKSNFSLSAKRASEDALKNLVKALSESEALRR